MRTANRLLRNANECVPFKTLSEMHKAEPSWAPRALQAVCVDGDAIQNE